MTYQRSNLSLRVLIGVVCFMLFTPALIAQEQEDKQETVYQATIVGVRGRAGARSMRLTIRIQGSTSDEQVQQYLEMVPEGNQLKELRRTLEKVRDLGRVSVTGFIGNELAVIREFDTGTWKADQPAYGQKHVLCRASAVGAVPKLPLQLPATFG